MIDYSEFGHLAKTGKYAKYVALVRHAERPAIDPKDPTFGENLPITDAGKEMALRCGAQLAKKGPAASAWDFRASRLLRTRLTAAAIAEGAGAARDVVRISPEASIPGLWVEDQAETHRHYEAEGSVPFTSRLIKNGWAEGYRSVAESTRLALEWLDGDSLPGRFSIIVTHDVFVACLLLGMGEKRVDCDLWVGFLQGIALMRTTRGKWDFDWLVPDKNNWKAKFVQ